MPDYGYGDIVDGKCSKCGHVWEAGDWPMCPHGHSVQTSAFRSYFDDGIGEEITSLGQRHQAMREHHLSYREHPPKGQLSARRDQIEQQKREARG